MSHRLYTTEAEVRRFYPTQHGEVLKRFPSTPPQDLSWVFEWSPGPKRLRHNEMLKSMCRGKPPMPTSSPDEARICLRVTNGITTSHHTLLRPYGRLLAEIERLG